MSINLLLLRRLHSKAPKLIKSSQALIAGAFLVFSLAACGSGDKTANDNANRGAGSGTASAAEARPIEVSTAAAEGREVPSYLEATGSLVADEASDVASEVSGQVVATPVDVGAFVGADSVIARLDNRDAQLRLQQAQSATAQAQSALSQAQTRLGLAPGDKFNAASIPEAQAARAALESAEASARLAETNARRYAILVESGDVSRSVYDTARTQAETARAQAASARQQLETVLNTVRGNNQGIASAEAGLASARLQVALAQKAVADSVIRAPFSGFVSERAVAVGEYVTPASRVATVLRINPIKLLLQVSESEAGRVRVGLQVAASVAGFPDRQFAGRVVAINPAVDPTSRVLSAEVKLENTNNLLRPGIFATARVLQSQAERGIFVPRAAVQTNQNTNSSTLYVIEESGNNTIARLRVVQRGSEEGDFIRILSGLQPGENVVTSNASGLYDGAPVSKK
ncbi:MAG: efflux RND transporter periplasmic adaptor subunit [Pyrinomonadaceae bacterium]